MTQTSITQWSGLGQAVRSTDHDTDKQYTMVRAWSGCKAHRPWHRAAIHIMIMIMIMIMTMIMIIITVIIIVMVKWSGLGQALRGTDNDTDQQYTMVRSWSGCKEHRP